MALTGAKPVPPATKTSGAFESSALTTQRIDRRAVAVTQAYRRGRRVRLPGPAGVESVR